MSLFFIDRESTFFTKKRIFFSFVFLYAIALLFTNIYSISIDNFYISCVSSGLYDTENYCIFVHPFVADILQVLNNLFSEADFFCIFQILFTFCGYVWLLSCLYRTSNTAHDYLIYTIAVFSLVIMLDIAHVNFTIASAFFALVGFVSLGNYICGRGSFSNILLGLFFIILGLLWRIQAVLLLLPYFLLSSFATPFWVNKSGKMKSILHSFLCVFLVLVSLGITYSSKKIVDSSPFYSDAVDYNTARAKLQDYPIPPYEDVKEELDKAGISKTDFSVATDMIFFDTDLESTAFLQNLTRIFAEKNAKNTLSQFISVLIDNAADFSLASILFLFLFALLFSFQVFRSGKRIVIIEFLCAIGGTILIILYFFILGRLLDRILIAVLFGLFQIILLRLPETSICFHHIEKKNIIPVYLCISLSLLCSAVSFIKKSTLPENAFHVKKDVDYGPYEMVLDNNNLYIWDTYYMKNLVFETLIPQGKLYTEEFLDNNIPDGEWIYGQPYFNSYLSRLGVDNPVEELLYNDHCYYISRQYRKDIVLNYIHEHYDADATIEKCGDIVLDEERSMAIYKIVPGSNDD